MRLDLLRFRLLAIVAPCALVGATTHCGGTTSNEPSGSDSGSGSGGSPATGSSTGGTASSSGGVGANGGDGGTASSSSGGTTIYGPGDPTCPPSICLSYEQLVSCNAFGQGTGGSGGSGGSAAGAPGSAGEGGEVGAPDEWACPATTSVPVACFPPSHYSTAVVRNGDQCCFSFSCYGASAGRPFLIDGSPRIAALSTRGDWQLELFDLPAVSDEERRSLARSWLDEALLEHASVASFARLTLELLALGAPPELVALSQQAGLDEIEHARLCFALAGHYGRTEVGPGPLRLEGALGEVTLASLAVRAVEEGCVGETLAALLVAERAESAATPRLREALLRVSEDETRHAELAWRVARWAIEQGGEPVRAAVAGALARAVQRARLGAASGEASSARLTERALSEVVEPCARALLGEPPLGAAA